MAQNTDRQFGEVLGIAPMAGQASRLAGLRGSKEIFPVAAATDDPEPPLPVCEHLLRAMRRANIGTVYVVIRDGKWDIPACLGDGSHLGLHLAYLMPGRPWGTPYSADQAYPFVRRHRVALGFPDMWFDNTEVFARALAHQETSGADVVLGLFPADRPEKVDMVEVGDDHRVRQIVIKPAATPLQLTWGIAVWTPVFTEFMHRFLTGHEPRAETAPELFVGDVIRAAMQAGLDVQAAQVSQQPFVDIGTWEDLQRLR